MWISQPSISFECPILSSTQGRIGCEQGSSCGAVRALFRSPLILTIRVQTTQSLEISAPNDGQLGGRGGITLTSGQVTLVYVVYHVCRFRRVQTDVSLVIQTNQPTGCRF